MMLINAIGIMNHHLKLISCSCLDKRDHHGQDVKWTYEQYMQDVRTAAKGFLELGLERFHTVGILGYNSPEWVISHVAAVHAGGFAMGIYQVLTKYKGTDCD